MGQRLAAVRESLNLNRAQAAKLVNVSWQYWSDIETGKKIPSLDKLWEIAGQLGVDPNRVDPRLASPVSISNAEAEELKRLRDLVAEMRRSLQDHELPKGKPHD